MSDTQQQPESAGIGRREFARRGLLGGAAFCGLNAAERATAASEPAPPASALTPVNFPPDTPLPAAEALLLTWLVQEYPSPHYQDAGVLPGIYGDLRADLARSRELRRFPLTNADEPGPGFRVWRGQEEVLSGE